MSKGKRHVPQAPQPRPAAATEQKFPWEGKRHRLRTILVSGVVEVMNAEGRLEDVWTADAFPIHEAKIPADIRQLVSERLHVRERTED